MKVLILYTGNSCRSQMVQGFLQSFEKKIEVCSAGTIPSSKVNSKAIKVMTEVGIDISKNTPKSINEFLDDQWDYVITECDDANETCPVFLGKVKHRLHMGFEDPSNFEWTDMQIMNEFRRIRDEIRDVFYKFYKELLV